MIAVADQRAVRVLDFVDRRGLPGHLDRVAKTHGRIADDDGSSVILDRVESALRGYLSGDFDGAPFAEIAWEPGRNVSAFQRRAWDALLAIPLGQTRSYAQQARAIGSPDAVRAVARANGENYLSLIVPCHRVIGSDGALTGYGGGLDRKRWLLEHEARLAGAMLTA